MSTTVYDPFRSSRMMIYKNESLGILNGLSYSLQNCWRVENVFSREMKMRKARLDAKDAHPAVHAHNVAMDMNEMPTFSFSDRSEMLNGKMDFCFARMTFVEPCEISHYGQHTTTHIESIYNPNHVLETDRPIIKFKLINLLKTTWAILSMSKATSGHVALFPKRLHDSLTSIVGSFQLVFSDRRWSCFWKALYMFARTFHISVSVPEPSASLFLSSHSFQLGNSIKRNSIYCFMCFAFIRALGVPISCFSVQLRRKLYRIGSWKQSALHYYCARCWSWDSMWTHNISFLQRCVCCLLFLISTRFMAYDNANKALALVGVSFYNATWSRRPAWGRSMQFPSNAEKITYPREEMFLPRCTVGVQGPLMKRFWVYPLILCFTLS